MIKPFGKTLLIQRTKLESESSGGILMPDSYQERKLNQGTVIEVGTDPDLYIEVGNLIVFNDFVGTEVAWEDQEYLIISEEEVVCILPEE